MIIDKEKIMWLIRNEDITYIEEEVFKGDELHIDYYFMKNGKKVHSCQAIACNYDKDTFKDEFPIRQENRENIILYLISIGVKNIV